MAQTATYSPDLLPEASVPPELDKKGLYRPAGFTCRDCDFVTKKKGFQGKQALRAHLKRHKNDRRSWQVPFIRQSVVVVMLLGIAVMGWLGAVLPFDVPFETPVVTFPAEIAKWAVIGSTTALIVASMYMMSVPGEVGGRNLARVLSVLTVVGSLVGLLGLAVAWEWVGPALSWPVQVPLLGLVALTPLMAAKVGRVRLLVRRRGVRSGAYAPLVEPKNAKARVDIRRWWERWQRRKPKVRKPRGGKTRITCPGCGLPVKKGTQPGVGKCTACGTHLEAKTRV